MKHPRKSTSNRGFQLTAEAAALLSEQYERRHHLTPEGAAEVEKQSHKQLVDEAIEEMEQEEAAKVENSAKPDRFSMLMDCSNRLHQRWLVFFEKLQALDVDDIVSREKLVAKIHKVQRASRRVTRKMTWLLEIQRDYL